jgi:hypothetical protein
VWCSGAWFGLSVGRRVLLTVALSVVASGAALAVPAAADVAVEQGVVLPQRIQQTPSAALMSASNTLFLLKGGKDVDPSDRDTTYQVVRRSDGVVLRTFSYTPTNPYDFPYELVGDDLVRLVGSADTQAVEVTDAATGAGVHTIDVANQSVLHADADWALAATPATNGQYSLQIDRADGTTTAVSGSFSHALVWVGTEAGTGYVRGSDGSFSIDLTNGALTLLPIPSPERLEFVTPGSLVTFNATFDGTGAQTDHLRSLDRTTYDQWWSVDTPTDGHNHGYVVLGNGLGVMYAPDGAPSPVSNHLHLRPVDLATGALETPAARDVYDRLQLADGTVALTLDDTPGGRLAVADGTSVNPWGDLPDVHAPVLTLGLSGSTVFTTWSDQDGIWSAPAGGSAPWSVSDRTSGFSADETGKSFSVAGDVVMAGVDHYADYGIFRLTWPGGGSRTFGADGAVLGHGGRYVEEYSKASTDMRIVDARTGALVTSAPDWDSVVDGTVLWVRSPSGDVLTSTDLATSQATTVNLPTECATASLFDVRGRWAELECSTGQVLLDLQDTTHIVHLPSGSVGHLGDGYTVQLRSPDGGKTDQAIVTSAVTGESRTYGPLRTRNYLGPNLAVNDDNTTQQMVYADRTSQARIVDLSWVKPTITASAAPTIAGTARVGSTLTATPAGWNPADATVTYQWLADGVPISGATTASLALIPAHLGRHIAVRTTATKRYLTTVTATSAAVTIAPGLITNPSPPTVRGVPRTGHTLTAATGVWTPTTVTYRYQWLRDGRTIVGAHGRTYKLNPAAKGHRFSVRITATKPGYVKLAKTSAKTSRVH